MGVTVKTKTHYIGDTSVPALTPRPLSRRPATIMLRLPKLAS